MSLNSGGPNLQVNCFVPSSGRSHYGIGVDAAGKARKDWGGVLWVDIEAQDADDLQVLDTVFGFDPFAIEDCMEEGSRVKLEHFKDYLFAVLMLPTWSKDERRLVGRELDIFFGPNYLVTVHRVPLRLVQREVDVVRRDPKGTLGRGAEYVLYRLLDQMADDFIEIMQGLDERIQSIEDEIFQRDPEATLQEIVPLRIEILELRRILLPQREMIYQMSRGNYGVIPVHALPYFRDVYDHWVKIQDLIESHRESIGGLLEAYSAMVQTRTNRVMMALTMLTVLFLPPTLIAGIYGMNVKDLPGLTTASGGWIVLGAMFLVTLGFVTYFRLRRWW